MSYCRKRFWELLFTSHAPTNTYTPYGIVCYAWPNCRIKLVRCWNNWKYVQVNNFITKQHYPKIHQEKSHWISYYLIYLLCWRLRTLYCKTQRKSRSKRDTNCEQMTNISNVCLDFYQMCLVKHLVLMLRVKVTPTPHLFARNKRMPCSIRFEQFASNLI